MYIANVNDIFQFVCYICMYGVAYKLPQKQTLTFQYWIAISKSTFF